MKLHYYYDKEVDVFYISQGKPSRTARSVEAPDDVILRTHPKSRKVTGFTVLNFSRRLGRKTSAVSLPIELHMGVR